MSFLLLLQSPTPTAVAPHVPERMPALLTLIYVGGFGLIILLLLVSLFRNRRRIGATAVAVPARSSDRSQKASRFDVHKSRAAGFALALRNARPWSARFSRLLGTLRAREERKVSGTDPTRTCAIAVSQNRLFAAGCWTAAGSSIRRWPSTAAIQVATSRASIRWTKPMAHIFGSDRGDPGLERALFGVQSGALPEALEVVKGETLQNKGNTDVVLTIDRDLQQAAVDQLKGKHGAVVVLNPQTGEVLALYSEPSYSLKEVEDETTWIRLAANRTRSSRSSVARLGAYYIPGSTFKTVTMTAAFIAGMQDTEFVCSGGGYYAAPGANVIFDDGGPGEVHGKIGIDIAYEVSCNQYFAQMGVKLGAERLKQAASYSGLELTTLLSKPCADERNLSSGTPAPTQLSVRWPHAKPQ